MCDPYTLSDRSERVGIEVTIINQSHRAGWINAALCVGEIYMTDVRSMVDNVLLKLGYDPHPLPLATRVEADGRPYTGAHGGANRLKHDYQRLSLLTIADHGHYDEDDANYADVDIGWDNIDRSSFHRFRDQFARLAKHFDKMAAFT